MTKLTKFFLIYLILLHVSNSSSPELLYGYWQVIDVFPLITMSPEDLNFIRGICINAIIEIRKDSSESISIFFKTKKECDQEKDFERCNNVKVSVIYLQITQENEYSKKYPGGTISRGTIDETFLKVIGYNKRKSKVIATYDVNCHISWGDETFKIIPVRNDVIVFYLGGYAIKLKKKKIGRKLSG